MSKIENIEFTKLTMNVPKKLLKQFETMAYLNNYSRTEAVKEAMRIFIEDKWEEDPDNKEEIKSYWRNIMDAIVEISADPKYQSLSPDQQQLITQQTPMTVGNRKNFSLAEEETQEKRGGREERKFRKALDKVTKNL